MRIENLVITDLDYEGFIDPLYIIKSKLQHLKYRFYLMKAKKKKNDVILAQNHYAKLVFKNKRIISHLDLLEKSELEDIDRYCWDMINANFGSSESWKYSLNSLWIITRKYLIMERVAEKIKKDIQPKRITILDQYDFIINSLGIKNFKKNLLFSIEETFFRFLGKILPTLMLINYKIEVIKTRILKKKFRGRIENNVEILLLTSTYPVILNTMRKIGKELKARNVKVKLSPDSLSTVKIKNNKIFMQNFPHYSLGFQETYNLYIKQFKRLKNSNFEFYIKTGAINDIYPYFLYFYFKRYLNLYVLRQRVTKYISLFHNLKGIMLSSDRWGSFGMIEDVAKEKNIWLGYVQHGTIPFWPTFSEIYADKAYLFGNATKKILTSLGAQQEKLIVTGACLFNVYNFKEEDFKKDDGRTILYILHAEIWYSIPIIKMLIKICEELNFKLLARPHPINPKLDELLTIKSKIFKILDPNEDLIEQIIRSTVVVSEVSTVLMLGARLGKKIIELSRKNSVDYQRYFTFGLSKRCLTYEELKDEFSKKSDEEFTRYMINKGKFFLEDNESPEATIAENIITNVFNTRYSSNN